MPNAVLNRTKYKNQPVIRNGRRFASLHEADVALQLQSLESSGAIKCLEYQIPFEILPSQKKLGYTRPLTYIADFVFLRDNEFVVADAKGYKTEVYKLKKRLLAQLHNITIEEM